MENKVFISYSHEDAPWARAFAEELKSRGLTTWFDEWDVSPGASLSESIERGLRDSTAVVFIWGPKSRTSPNLFFELGAAVALKKRVIPVLSRRSDIQMPVPLRQVRYIVQDSPEEAAEEVARAVAA